MIESYNIVGITVVVAYELLV